MVRRAMPAAEWIRVRKDATTTKDMVTSDAVAESGKAPPAHPANREFPGGRTKVPKIDDTADNTELVTLPRKKCNCLVEKCACQATKEDDQPELAENQPVQKPLPTPGGESNDAFIARCMADPKMNSEFPDEKQRAAVCYSQAKKAAEEQAQKALPEDANASGDDGPGMMLALVPPPHVANKLAQPDGTDPNDMHVTLGYYGKVGEGKDIHPDHVATITKCVAMAAEGYKPVKAKIGGVGRFNGSHTSGGKDVLIAHVDSPDLHDVRDHLIEHVQKCSGIASSADSPPPGSAPQPTQFPGDPGQGGPPNTSGNAGLVARGFAHGHGPMPKRDHGYTPHIMLKYLEPDAQMPVHKLDSQEFTFTHLLMAVGKQKHLFPLGERAGVTKAVWMPILKSDNELRLVTGIVLQPEVVDAQGDIISADVIRDAAHNFLAKYNKATTLGLQHEIMKPSGVELVESWIVPVGYVYNGRDIPEGTWMMTVRVTNDDIWLKVKAGQITGFSIGGVAKVQRLSA